MSALERVRSFVFFTRDLRVRVAGSYLVVLLGLLSLGASSAEELRQELDHIFSDRALQQTSLGLRVVSVTSGKVLYSYHADRTLIPASNVKLATTAAALQYLGADYQFTTKVAATGAIDDAGVLHGDLVIVGGGDPNISGRFYGGDPTGAFRQWTAALRRRGLRVVAGDLIGDERFFDGQHRHPTWPKGQEAYWYEAPIGALSLNDNCVDFSLVPTVLGRPARLEVSPPTHYLQFHNRCLTRRAGGAPKVLFGRAVGSREVSVRGSIPEGVARVTNYVTVDNPGEFFLVVLRPVLLAEGIEVKGKSRLVEPDETLPPLTVVVEHRSGLAASIRVANKRSQNFYAEQILKTLGRELLAEGSFAQGVEAVMRFLAQATIDTAGCRLVDGSGLSRENRLSARCITELLVHMARSPVADIYIESLSQAGVDGSLRRRPITSEVQAEVFGKTGTLAGVRALSGYVRTPGGELLAYSFLMNGPAAGSWQARQLQNQALDVLARY